MNVSTNQNNTLVTVTYRDVFSNMMIEQTVVLVVNPNTIVLNENGNAITASSLQVGMLINAIISSTMTRSNPPQSNVYLIVIVSNAEQPSMPEPPSMSWPSRPQPPRPPMPRPPRPQPPRPPMPRPQPPSQDENVTFGTIINVERNNRNFTTISNQDFATIIRFNVPEETPIYSRAGRMVNFSNLTPGMRVRVTHANFMTASIPPQTTAFEVQIL